MNQKVKTLVKNVEKLQEGVREASVVSGGGIFHWVDSILVKVCISFTLMFDGLHFCLAYLLRWGKSYIGQGVRDNIRNGPIILPYVLSFT